MKIEINQGAPRIRIGPKKQPGLVRWLLRLNEVLGKDPKIDWERDGAHHQTIVYFSDIGYHTTKILHERENKNEKLG